MSVECGECEHDLRGGHDDQCSRHPRNRKPKRPAAKRTSFGKIAKQMRQDTGYDIEVIHGTDEALSTIMTMMDDPVEDLKTIACVFGPRLTPHRAVPWAVNAMRSFADDFGT